MKEIVDVFSLYEDHFKHCTENAYQIMEKLGIEQLLIHSGSEIYAFLDDQTYPFRGNPHFNYFVPGMGPENFLLLAAGKKPRLFFYRPTDFWHFVPPLPPDEISQLMEVTPIESNEDVKKELKGKVHLFSQQYETLSSWGVENARSDAFLLEFHYLRTQKTAFEKHCLVEATRRAVAGHRKVQELFSEKHRVTEFDLLQAFLGACKMKESDAPYGVIIGFNEHASILHYVESQTRPPEMLRSLLIDAGSTHLGYASDITRTYARDERSFFHELVMGMEKMQQEIIAEITVGKSFVQQHEDSHRKLAQLLLDFGIIQEVEAEEAFEKKLTHVFYPHGLGHLLGLQVHDVGGFKRASHEGMEALPDKDHPYLRCTQNISPGHVFTIEPGLYFIDCLLEEAKKNELAPFINWDRVSSLKPFGGIRIEDNIFIEKNGEVFNMTRSYWNE